MVTKQFMLTVTSLLLMLPCAGLAADDPKYVIEAPDILRVEVFGSPEMAQSNIQGEHLVRPDGTISLGAYGSVSVSGLSLEQTQAAVAKHLAHYAKKKEQPEVRVEVLAFNSKAYYVLTGDINGEQVHRCRLMGGATVAGAILQVEGLAARAAQGPVRLVRGSGKVLSVDWRAITQEGKSATNFQLESSDRLYVGIAPPK